MAHFGAQHPRRHLGRQIEPATDAGHGQILLREFAEVVHQAVQRVVLWIHRPDDFVHAPRQFAGHVRYLTQMDAGFLRRRAPRQFGQQADVREARAQIVVDVLGDAGAIPFHGALPFQNFQLAAQFANDHLPHRDRDRAKDHNSHQHRKPGRLVKMRQHRQQQIGAFVAPHTVVVAGDDVKVILPRPQEAVLRRPAGARLHPIRIQTIQLVAEPNPVG